jgi:hypothetical protein
MEPPGRAAVSTAALIKGPPDIPSPTAKASRVVRGSRAVGKLLASAEEAYASKPPDVSQMLSSLWAFIISIE